MNLFYRIILLIVFVFQSIVLFGQKSYEAQHVSYDLNQKSFNDKLSYLKLIKIEGLPVLDGKTYDIIKLEVFSTSSSVTRDVKKKEEEIKEKKIEIAESLVEKSEAKKQQKDSLKRDELLKDLDELKKELIILNNQVNVHVPLTNAIWRRKEGDSKFEFDLTDLLKMEESYEFKFSMFSKSTSVLPSDEIAKEIIEEITSEVSLKKHVSADSIHSYILSSIENHMQGFSNGEKLFDKDLKEKNNFESEIKNDLTLDIAELSSVSFNISEDLVRLNEYQIEIETALYKTTGKIELKPIAKEQFRTICMNCDSAGFLDWTTKYGQNLLKENIDNALSAMLKYNESASKSYLRGIKKKTVLQARIDSTILSLVKDVYLKDISLVSNVSSTSVETDMEGKKLGTMYGVAWVPLGNGVNELTQFACFNFRFGSYDNRLKGGAAYESHLSRFSIMFGAATTKMEYKGQNLLNTRIGIKPMLGISGEPAKRINFNAGVVAFVQEGVIPEQPGTLTKFRFFAGVSFDFDAINELIKQ